MMTNFFHRLFNPHCPHCVEEVRENKVCSSCETLKMMLEQANYEKKQLLDRILEKPEIPVESAAPELTRPKTVPWAVRKQLLEAEDRKRAQLMREAPKPLDELEKEVVNAGE